MGGGLGPFEMCGDVEASDLEHKEVLFVIDLAGFFPQLTLVTVYGQNSKWRAVQQFVPKERQVQQAAAVELHLKAPCV